MSFNFGNTSAALGATSTPSKPSFGNFSLSGQAATAAFGAAPAAFGAASGFGGGTATTGFGTPAANTGFGAPSVNTGFGAPTANTGFGAPAVNTGFGAPATNTGFGAPAANTGFGAPSANTGFGAPAVNTGFGAPTAISGFGAPATGFGGGAFGAVAPVSAAPSAFSFGATATSAPTGLTGFGGAATTGFGQTTSAPSFSGFGTTAAAPSFSGLGGGFGGGFGTTATTAAPLFGGFGTTAPAATSTGFAGFGSSLSTSFGTKPAATSFAPFGSSFGQPQQQQQQQLMQPPPLNPDEAFSQSIFHVSIFGDERDTLIARWNYLQAMWGTGKSFYSQTSPPIDITLENFLCRFKSMGYSKLSGKENKFGLVGLIFNKSVAQVKEQQQQLIANLNQMFGNKPNLVINVESVKPLSESKCQFVIYVEERGQNPSDTKRIPATELHNFLNQPNTKQQLSSLAIEQTLALVLPDEDQIKEFLENPPKGVDPRMWKQAKLDNPNSAKFVPVPVTGFEELKWRVKIQENETENHSQYLSNVKRELSELTQRHSSMSAKILERKRSLAELSHNILKIIVKQESTRKMGCALSLEEEISRSKLENMQALISAPTQFKGRLSELLSQMRMQRNQWSSGGSNEYILDKDSTEEMKNFLSMQQKAMTYSIETVNKDLNALKIIIDGMKQLTRA